MCGARLRGAAHLQDEEVAQDQVCEAAGHNVHKGQDKAPDHKDSPGLWQLKQVGDLEASEVVHAEEQDECLQGSCFSH